MTTLPTEGDAPVTTVFWRQNRFACVAFLLAFVALALVLLPPFIFEPPRSSESAVRGLLRALTAKPDEAQMAYEARMLHFKIGSVAVAIVAAALALVGVVRRERRALALAALGVAAVAILWHYLIVGIVIAVIAAIVLSALN